MYLTFSEWLENKLNEWPQDVLNDVLDDYITQLTSQGLNALQIHARLIKMGLNISFEELKSIIS